MANLDKWKPVFSRPGANFQFAIEKTVEASESVVFEVMSTETGMRSWVPYCRSALWQHPAGVQSPGLASVRHFQLAGGVTAAERIVLWIPGHQINYRFDQTTLPIDKLTRNYEGAMRVDGVSPFRSRLIWAVSFEMSERLRLIESPVRAAFRVLLGAMADKLVRAAKRCQGRLVDCD